MPLARRLTARIRPPLHGLHGQSLTVRTPEGDYGLHVRIVDADGAAALPEYVDRSLLGGDPLGYLHNSVVTVTFPRPWPIEAPPGYVSEAQTVAASVVNWAIDHFSAGDGRELIRRVQPSDMGWFLWESDAGEAGERPWLGLSPHAPDSATATVDQELVDLFRTIPHGSQPPYRTIRTDAVLHSLAQEYAVAVLLLCVSLEALVTMTHEAVGLARVGEAKYEAEFAAMVRDGGDASVRAALKQINAWAETRWGSNTKLMGRFQDLWERRNDFIHGRRANATRRVFQRANAAYLDIALWLDNELTLAGGPVPQAYGP